MVFAGVHELRLQHPGYPPFVQQVEIHPRGLKFVAINLDTLFGFIDCKVLPWGEISVDGQSIGQTPLLRAVKPGRYLLTITNPKYTSIDEYITILQNDTLQYRFDYERLVAPKADTSSL